MAKLGQAAAAARLLVPVGMDEALEARRLFRRRGLEAPSLRAYRNAWRARLHLLPPGLALDSGLVVDVGANEGDFSQSVLTLAPSAKVIAAEPAPGPRRALEERLAGRGTVVGKAVSSHTGTAKFHVTAHSHNSSLQAPRDATAELYEDEGWHVTEEVEVETVTLDDLVGGQDVAVLKIDVQGGEMDVLAGGAETLSRTAAVLLEVTFVSHYEGDATFNPLHRRMEELGFELSAISVPGRSGSGLTTWADACYVPAQAASSAS